MGPLHMLLKHPMPSQPMRKTTLSQQSTSPIPRIFPKQATKRSNQVVDLQPLLDPNNICLLLTHSDLPEDFATESIEATFSLDPRALHCYLVEDYLFASKGE
jgi:hypothetical protein